MVLIRSTLFNIAFFSWLVTSAVCFVWAAWLPRDSMMALARWVLSVISVLERTLAGIRYEVVGMENLPPGGCFIVAAKHQSAWETMKLHTILHDPAVVLKRELTQVPVWGLMARKSRMIPVDRGAKGRAISSMLKGALAIKAEGRPILIFPQGTRVAPGARVPYKIGVALMYDKLKVPVVPMALNSGVFWARNAYFKRPGTITVEFLPAIPAGLPREEMMARLEEVLETASDRLVQQVGGPALPPRDDADEKATVDAT